MVRRQDYKANNPRFESRVQTLGFPFKQDMFISQNSYQTLSVLSINKSKGTLQLTIIVNSKRRTR